jgi:chemotaxis signal transduction protein
MTVLTPSRGIGSLHVVARVGTERFAFRVADVEEALDAPRVLPVPGAAPGLVGQIRHRERTVGAWDGAWVLGTQTAEGRPESGEAGPDPAAGRISPRSRVSGNLRTALILRHGDHRAALLVDDVDDLAVLEAARLRSAPPGTDPDGLLHGVALDQVTDIGLIGVVNVSALLERVERLGVAPPGVIP